MFLATEQATHQLAQKIAPLLKPGMVIFLHGDLGVGKTTLVRGIFQALGYTDRIKSPTYSIVEPYQIKSQQYYHLDLYRVQHAEELLYLGLDEIFQHDTICLIEWPEQGKGELPEPDVEITLIQQGDGRELTISGLSL